MSKKLLFLEILLFIWCFGCYVKTEHKITAHITIDVRQIKEAASNIEDMVSKTPKTKPNSRLFFGTLEAYAQTTQLKYLTPEIEEAIERRKSRYPQIEELLNEGAIGENNLGLLERRGKSDILSEEELEDIVSEENGDRMFIYESILRQNNLPQEALRDIQRAFAEERQNRVNLGVWIQLSDGKWKRK